MKHKIRGKIWNIKYASNMKNRGYCDPPDKKNKSITIKKNLKGQELMEVLLHECLHAVLHHELDEDYVLTVADDISRAIWKELKAKGYINEH
jgi:hypothetical protein